MIIKLGNQVVNPIVPQMKKAISRQLMDLAEHLPQVWEDQLPEIAYISGAELNLCTKGLKYDPKKIYQYKVPVSLLVNHYTRLKDGVKQFGLGYITTYTNQILTS